MLKIKLDQTKNGIVKWGVSIKRNKGVSLSGKSTKTNKLIYSKQLLNIKGLKKGLILANQDSYSKLIRKIKEETQEEMWKSIGLANNGE